MTYKFAMPMQHVQTQTVVLHAPVLKVTLVMEYIAQVSEFVSYHMKKF